MAIEETVLTSTHFENSLLGFRSAAASNTEGCDPKRIRMILRSRCVMRGLLDFSAIYGGQLRVPSVISLVVFLLFACSITRTPSIRFPDASKTLPFEDANQLREPNHISVNDAFSLKDADVSKDAYDKDVTVASRDSSGVDAQPREEALLAAAPLIFATTDTAFGINLVLSQGELQKLELQVRDPTQTRWSVVSNRSIKADDVAQWRVQELAPSTKYEYRVLYRIANDQEDILYSGRIRTRRERGESFSFCILTDPHVFVDYPSATGDTVTRVAQNIKADDPDFVINLGDTLDFHSFGFNQPPPERKWTKIGYLFYRGLMNELLGQTTHFSVIGNWDGENGDFAAEEIERSRSQRLLYLPGPDSATYPQGGSTHQDYYAFTWGNALFVVLNVMTYTPSGHYLSGAIGLPDDWTLGEAQLRWFEDTLKNTEYKWRMIFIHHVVGGNAGNEANSAYGRGGGRAALVGEQATVHALMRDYGVHAFFYGHDHVFFDMVVDGIHYTIPGSAGAPWKFTTYETGYPTESYWPDSGHAKVDVTPNHIDVAFINIDSETIYRYTIE